MRHKWDHANQQRLAADGFEDGCERNIRVCEQCGMKRFTVIPPRRSGEDDAYPWREWETADGLTHWRSDMTPPCVRVEVKSVKKLKERAYGGC
jgi:hypothetical protein